MKTIIISSDLAEITPGTHVTRSLRNFDFVVALGEKVALKNLLQNESRTAIVVSDEIKTNFYTFEVV